MKGQCMNTARTYIRETAPSTGEGIEEYWCKYNENKPT